MTDFVYYDKHSGVVDHTIADKMTKDLGNMSLTGIDSMVNDFVFYASNSRLLPNWWTQQRDDCLRKASIENDLLSSTLSILIMLLYSVPIKAVPRDSMVLAHNKTAEFYNTILQNSWANISEKVFNDLLVCDKGAFIYINSTTSASLPLDSAPTELMHLDSGRVILTNDIERPYIYQTKRGENVRIHKSRIIQLVQMPSPVYEDASIGLSYISRAYNIASLMKNINQYELEVLGGMDASKIIWATSTNSANLKQAFKESNLEAIAQGKIHDANDVYIGLRDPQSRLGVLDLKRFPEGFKREEYSNTILNLLSIAAGIDSDVFAPTSQAGTTKSAALLNDLKGKYKLPSWYASKISMELENKFLPPTLKLQVGDKQSDINESTAKALINIGRVEKLLVDTGTIDVRVARENAVKNGSLTHQQFVYLELNDGRLPDGLPSKTLFFKNEATMQKLLSLEGISDPCLITENQYNAEDIISKIDRKLCILEEIAINAKSSQVHLNARSAMSAMTWLKGEYTNVLANSNNGVDNIVDSDDVSDSTDDNGQPIVTEEILSNTRKGRDLVKNSRKLVKSVWEKNSLPQEIIDDLLDLIGSELEVETEDLEGPLEEYLDNIEGKGVDKLTNVYGGLNDFLLGI